MCEHVRIMCYRRFTAQRAPFAVCTCSHAPHTRATGQSRLTICLHGSFDFSTGFCTCHTKTCAHTEHFNQPIIVALRVCCCMRAFVAPKKTIRQPMAIRAWRVVETMKWLRIRSHTPHIFWAGFVRRHNITVGSAFWFLVVASPIQPLSQSPLILRCEI